MKWTKSSRPDRQVSKVKKNDADERREKAPDKKAVRPLPGAQTVVIRDWKHPAAIGYALITFTFVVLGGWSAVAKLDSAVTAPGVVAEGSWSQIRSALRRRYR